MSHFWGNHNNDKKYEKHINTCFKSDICFLIRGDRHFCYVFSDYLHAEILFVSLMWNNTNKLDLKNLDWIKYFFSLIQRIYNMMKFIIILCYI